MKRKTLDIMCKCGQLLAKYQKGGKGRLRKMFLERITLDAIGRFLTSPQLELSDDVICPNCEKRVATIQVINGKYAAKMNQGAIEQI